MRFFRINTPDIYINDSSSGVLTSPNYPSNYDNYLDQLYYVVAPTGFQVSFFNIFKTQINFTITDFSTETDRDVLTIFDAPKADFSTPPIATFALRAD